MANHGHYGGGPGSRQGTYVCSPSGKFLASINSNDPDRTLSMLQEGLQAWEKLVESERRLSSESRIKPRHRWEDSYPSDGLVLNVINRDLPEQCDPNSPCEVKWNQDHIWFSQEEARQWLGENPSTGDRHDLPDDLVARLAQLHFIDSVKGQTARFSRKATAGSTISTEVVERKGSLVTLKISGLTKGSNPEGWWQSANGVTTRSLGHATYDLERQAFVEFELVALGRRWGFTKFNGRRDGAESGPLGFVFRLSPPSAYRIAPAAIASYDAAWVVRPDR
jgi:hypothetical protein